MGLEYKVGDRVVIVKGEGVVWGEDQRLARRDPYPEHLGKTGIIARLSEGDVPTIRLIDGTELEGCVCWWAKLADGW